MMRYGQSLTVFFIGQIWADIESAISYFMTFGMLLGFNSLQMVVLVY